MDNNEDINQINDEETLYDEMDLPEELPTENYDDEGAYQASSNRVSRNQKNIEANKKVSKMATQAAGNYFGGPIGGKVVNAINNTKIGDRLNEAIGRRMNDISKRTFAGRAAQNAVNKLDDNGTLDKGQDAMNAMSGSKDGKTQINNKTNPGNNKQKLNSTMNPKKSTIDTSKDKKNEIVRKKIVQFIIKHPWILGIILILFLLMIIMLVILGGGGGAQEEANYGGIAFNGTCSEMPIYGTTLSRSEYVEKIHAYFNKNDRWESKIYDNAGNIYDIATKNGVNPELVVARAVLEKGDSDYITNNYWGIGVYNGQPSGSVFATFSEGILAFVNIVKQYSAAYEMMLSYAYIGTYWAADDSKTGGNCSTGYGGCYYLPYMKDYYDNESDYKKAESACNKSSCSLTRTNGVCNIVDASKCVKTRSTGSDNVDQVAYAKYQVGRMAAKRKLIFGLDPVDCSAIIDDDGNSVDISNINDIRELGTLIAKKAVATFDHYEYSKDLRNNPGYVDCSSMVDRAYRLFGIEYLYAGKAWGNAGTTVTESQWCRENGAVVNSTNVNDLIPGDLIFNNNWGHVVMYIGNGQIFEASGHYLSNPESDVRVTSYYGGTVMVCRPLRVYFRNKSGSNNA